MCKSSIPMLHLIRTFNLQPALRGMSKRSVASTTNVSERWSLYLFLCLYSQPLTVRACRSTMIIYKRLAHLLSVKRDESYNHVIRWLRCYLAFALLQSAIMCLRGSRSLNTCNDCPSSISQLNPYYIYIGLYIYIYLSVANVLCS